jgi:HK97 family phage prohead protease
MTEFIERAVDFEPLPAEERKDSGGDGRTLEGYAAVFDADTEINSWEGHFKERIVRGAFRKTLRERTPVLQFDHGHDSRFGSLPIGSFEQIKEDKHGLRVQARLFDHAEPIREAIASGAVSGMSFRFKVVRDEWADNKGNVIKDRNELVDLLYGGDKKRGPLQRTIKEVKLMEAGPVVFPAYPQTSVGVRSMTDDQRREAIEELARAGDSAEVTDEDVERVREEALESLVAAGYDADEAEEILRAFPPKKGDDKGKPGDKAKPFAKKGDGDSDKGADSDKECSCDKVKGKHKMSDHPKKTSSDPKAKAGSEKKSASDDDTVAPAVGAEQSDDARNEDQDDAAQAGTSTGMSKNARERALSLLDLI